MDGKLLVFVVLATLGHSAFARRSTSCYVLSEKETGVLSKLRADHDATILARHDGHILIYDLIRRPLVGCLFNCKSTTSDDAEVATIIAEVKRLEKMSTDYMLNAMQTALGDHRCDDVETTRTAIYDLVNEIYSVLPHQIESALSGRYSENNDSSFLPMIDGFVKELFKSIYTSYNTTDADTLAVIKTAEHRSVTGLRYATTPLLNVLTIIAHVIASGKKSEALMHEVDTAFLRSSAGVEIQINNQGAIFEAMYFYSVLHRRGIMRGLVLIRYAAIVRFAKLKETLDIIFKVLFDQLYRNSLKLLKETKEVLSRTDLAKAKTAALYVAATDAFIEVCLFLRPRDSGEVKHVQEVVNTLSDNAAVKIFKMIELAMDEDKRYSQIIAEMHTLENELVQLFSKITKLLSDAMSGGKDSREENHNECEIIIEKNTVLAASSYVRIIRDGTLRLAKAVHKIGAASTDNFSTHQDLKKQGEVAIRNYVESFANAFCLKLLDSYES